MGQVKWLYRQSLWFTDVASASDLGVYRKHVNAKVPIWTFAFKKRERGRDYSVKNFNVLISM